MSPQGWGVHFGFNCIGQEVLGQMGLNLMRGRWEDYFEHAQHHPLSLGLGLPSVCRSSLLLSIALLEQ